MSFFGKPSGEEPRITFERIDLSAPALAEPPARPEPTARQRVAAPMPPGVMLIAADSEIEGQLRSRGAVRVEGVLRGTIDAPLLLLEPGGLVEGTVIAERVRLSGTLRGTVMAREVEVVRTAALDAELVYDEISIERGARVRGLHRQRDPEPPPEHEALPAAEPAAVSSPSAEAPGTTELPAPALLAAAAATAALVAEAEAALQELAEASHAAAAAASDLAEEGVTELAGLEADLRATPERMFEAAPSA